MTASHHTAIRRLWALGIALLALFIVGSAQADAAKKRKKGLPEIDHAVASYESGTGQVGIAVNVEGAKKVHITYDGVTKLAELGTGSNSDTGGAGGNALAMPHWNQALFDAPLKDCYRIEVRAKNNKGAVKRRLGAGRLGTKGCD